MKEGEKKKRTFRHVSRRPRTMERTKRYPTHGTTSSWFPPAYRYLLLHTYIPYILAIDIPPSVRACMWLCAANPPKKTRKARSTQVRNQTTFFRFCGRDMTTVAAESEKIENLPTYHWDREGRRGRLWLVEWRISVKCTLIITIPQKEIAPT